MSHRIPYYGSSHPSRSSFNHFAPKGIYRRYGKRLSDVVLSLIFILTALPLIVLVACIVRIDGSPSFYRQPRIGLHGRIFMCWKFTSMKPDAERLLTEHLENDPAAATEWARNQKLQNDPRVTPVGRVLRKYSLDELPQIWNVLSGDMSLVGPRPMMPEQADFYPGSNYTMLRPGVTGPWQVSDRSRSSFAARAGHDDKYFEDISLGEDVRVMLRTVRVVVSGTGV
jgi:exopolysaccharide production protein ExoY